MPDEDRPARPRPRKRFGQHFLADRGALARIADAVNATLGETVIEVGPGRGALTDELVARGFRIIAIEIDRDLIKGLKARYAANPAVRIVEGDVLTVDLAALAAGEYRLVGNVPYYITTPIIFHALRAPRPLSAVYLVQREVAERLAAAPGSQAYGALSVNVQSVAQVELIGRVKAGAFHPPPKVESAIVRLVPLAHPVVQPDDEDALREFVIAAFGQRRKQITRVLRQIASLDAAMAESVLTEVSIEPTRRPETLTPAEFAALFAALRRSAVGQTRNT
jgi:16S rRNA (adenine1518-N6/adenine1519-N6)-dimethyltransferase